MGTFKNRPIILFILLKTKNTFFNLLIRETSHILCYKRLLNLTCVAYKNAIYCEMQFWLHCYTVVSNQALFRLSVYKNPAVYFSGAKKMCLCTTCNFGTLTTDERVDNKSDDWCFFCFWFAALQSTAIIMSGQSIHLTSLFLGKLEQAVSQYFVHIFHL